jgi:acyl transferase domain-containing protein
MAQRCAGASESRWISTLRKGQDDLAAMLESLGELHLLGQPIRWSAVLGSSGARRRATLPSYPFQRTPYWHRLESRGREAALAPTTSQHPLLGGVVSSPLHVFQSELGLNVQPWLADHRIFDFTLFPATGFLELALAAAREAFGGDAVVVRDLVIREGLQLPEDRSVTVQVIATPNTDDGLQVQVFSRAADAADGAASPWQLHVSGTALRDASGNVPARDLDALQRAASTQLPTASYYERLAAQGAHYGPTFRGISSMARWKDGVLGRVKLDGTAAVEAASLLLHPALLDACFQLVGAGLPCMCVPVGLSEYRVLRPGATAAWCHVSKEPADPDAEIFRADLILLDDAGTVVAEVRALELRRTTRASLQRAISKTTVADWSYEVDWPLSPLPTPARALDAGRWVVFADEGGVGAALS